MFVGMMDRDLHRAPAMIHGRICLFGAIAVVMTGCVDPESRFNEFRERLDASAFQGAGDAATCSVAPGSVAGLHLLALSVTLDPSKPILTLLDVSTPASGGGAAVQWTGSALSAADRKTPVGGSLPAGPFPIDPNGAFVAQLPGLQVTGQANPITGSDITADVTLMGTLCLTPQGFYCGTVTGQVSQPLQLDLQGSTFTLTPVPDAQTLPAQPPIDCAGTLAAPL